MTAIMKDNASGRWGVSVRYRIRNKMRTFWWLPPSPDMNPLETVWNDMKRKLGKEAYRLWTKADLAAFAKEQWEKVSKERLKALIATMPQPVKDLVAAKGGYTKW
jgi:transposase